MRSLLLAVALALATILPALADEDPLTISVSTLGPLAKGHSWHLSVNSAGQAELTVFTSSTIRKQFQVSEEQLAEFRKVMTGGKFFELKAAYGESIPEGNERLLTVTAGRQAHTVKLEYLRGSPGEASRALRLLVLVRGWFDEAEAVDLRKVDKANLDAAKE